MISTHNIIIADDDKLVSDLLRDQLSYLEEFSPVAAYSGEDVLSFIGSSRFSAIVLGEKLPDFKCESLYSLLRKMKILIPVIFILPVDFSNSPNSLKGEFVDFIIKPFSIKVLISTLRSQLQKFDASVEGALKIGPYIFQPASRLLFDAKKKIKIGLTDKETLILKYLYNAAGSAVNRDVLLEKVWGYNPGITTHTLETHIYRLRQKIEIRRLSCW